jgi:hypothetical protein
MIHTRFVRSSIAIGILLVTTILSSGAHAQIDACGHGWDGFLIYYGGKVLSQPAVYVVPWGWTYDTFGPYDPVTGLYDPDSELAAIRATFGHVHVTTPNTGLPGGRFLNTVGQYWGLSPFIGFEPSGNPVDAYKGMYLDSTPFDPNAADGGNPAGIVAEAINMKTLLGRAGDPQTIIVFLNPPSDPHRGNGYNRSTSSSNGNVTFIDVNYNGPGAIKTLFHEIAEVITDAWPNQPVSGPVAGWNEDPTNPQCQIGDMCLPYSFTVQVNPSIDPNSTVEIQELLSDDANGNTGHCAASYSTRTATLGIGTDRRLFQQSADVNQLVGLAATNAETVHGWHAWSGAPAGLIGEPTVASWGPKRLDVFVQDSNQVMRHASSSDDGGTNGWDNWGSLPSGWSFTNTPSAVSWGAGRIDLFSTGKNAATTALWQRTWDAGAFSKWHQVAPLPNGVMPATGPAVVTWGEGISPAEWTAWPTHPNDADFPWFNRENGIPLRQLHVFFLGTDGNVWHGAWVQGDNLWRWNSYAPPPFKVIGDPAAAGWGLGLSFDSTANADTIPAPRFDIIWRDGSGNYWDMVSADGGQSASCCGAWGHPAGFPFTSKPSIAALGDGRLIVGGRADTAGYQGASYQEVWDTSHLTGWMLTNGAFIGGVTVAAY